MSQKFFTELAAHIPRSRVTLMTNVRTYLFKEILGPAATNVIGAVLSFDPSTPEWPTIQGARGPIYTLDKSTLPLPFKNPTALAGVSVFAPGHPISPTYDPILNVYPRLATRRVQWSKTTLESSLFDKAGNFIPAKFDHLWRDAIQLTLSGVYDDIDALRTSLKLPDFGSLTSTDSGVYCLFSYVIDAAELISAASFSHLGTTPAFDRLDAMISLNIAPIIVWDPTVCLTRLPGGTKAPWTGKL